jgi:hypothetical protein
MEQPVEMLVEKKRHPLDNTYHFVNGYRKVHITIMVLKRNG